MPAMQDDTFQPLGDSPVLTYELRAASEDNIPTRDRAHLRAERTIADMLEDGEVSLNIQTEEIGSSATTIVDRLLSPPSSPPRLRPRSPRETLRKSPGTMQALDDSYCDRIRSKSSFGWYDESAAFESMDAAAAHPACCQIDDWRNLETWDGGKEHERQDEKNPDVEFEVPHAHVTATKTFRHACHGRPDSYALALGATRVIRVSPYASHAQYQVLLSTKDGVHKSWKRFSDFKLLAEYAKISNLSQSVAAWREIQQTRRWFRCLEANYLKTKCKLLERFLAQLLFEVPTPSLLLTFVGAGQPDFVRNDDRGWKSMP